MAPNQKSQILVWSLPTIAIILSYLWYKKKRESKSDPNSTIEEELEEANSDTNRSFSRSLSGVDTAPIDIIIPKNLRSHKSNSNPIVISDEDLDFEIQKIKSMKSGGADPFRRSQSSNDADIKKLPEDEVKRSTVEEKEATLPATPITPIFKSPKVIKCTPQKIILSSSSSPMVQKHAKSSENTLSPVKMEAKETICLKTALPSQQVAVDKNVETEEIQRQSAERDSANHSPADVMLASPSLSSISDNHSEGSNDSGKGGSDVATPPSRTPAGEGSISGDLPMHLIYEFAVPQNLVGRLIGRGGCIISDIKEKSRTRIMVKKHPTNSKMKICVIEGSQNNIDNALQLIRNKFPLKRYPEVTLEQIQYPPVSLTPDQLHLKLVEGINNDTIISCMVSPNHFFLQQPTHPSFPNLNNLSNCMNACYGGTDSPMLPNPIVENTVCAAQSEGDWYRVMVLSTDTEANTSYVIFLDYGGYSCIENSKLRQIRGDFLLLPFQAAECILANVRPIAEDGKWSDEAFSIVAEITKGALAYTQVADYTKDGVPLVLMYIFIGPQQVVFLNEELVNRGLAEWAPLIQDDTEGAVGGVRS